MGTTEQPINAPACFKCDDLGYVPGKEVFGVARCDCAIGVTADMRAPRAPLTVDEGSASALIREIHRTPYTLTHDKPLLERAYDLINEARDDGQVLTIELVPLDPLAMGHYEMVADLRPKRERAEPMERDDLIDCAILDPDPTVEWDKVPRGIDAAYKDAVIGGLGVYSQNADGSTEHVPAADMRPLQAMMYPDRRTEARKVIWPDPSKMNFTTERRDPHSTLTQEQFDKRSTDKKKRKWNPI